MTTFGFIMMVVGVASFSGSAIHVIDRLDRPSSAAARCNGMELLDKLAILTDAAKYDAACTSSGVRRSARPGMIGNTTSSIAGCCHSLRRRAMHHPAEGADDQQLRVRLQVLRQPPQQRYPPGGLHATGAGGADHRLYRRNYIEGLFLSSGVLRSPDYTTERMIECLRSCERSTASTGISMPKPSPAHRRSWCSGWGCWQTGSASTSSCPLRRACKRWLRIKANRPFCGPWHRSGTGPERARQS